MQKFLSIFLSVLLLTSAMNIAYGQHFCGGHLVKSMLTFSEATLSCGMEQAPVTCEKMPSEKTLHEKSCCENELHQVQTDEHFSGSHFQFDFHKNFTFAFVSVFVLDQIEETAQKVEFSKYYPPPIDKDVQVLYQVFLI